MSSQLNRIAQFVDAEEVSRNTMFADDSRLHDVLTTHSAFAYTVVRWTNRYHHEVPGFYESFYKFRKEIGEFSEANDGVAFTLVLSEPIMGINLGYCDARGTDYCIVVLAVYR